MSVRRVMGTETEFGISVPGQPGANPMVASSQVVNAYASRPCRPPRPVGLRGGVPAARRPRVRPVARGRRPVPADRRGPRPRQRHPHQRRAALRRPRPPGVLDARVHQPARHGALGQGGGACHGRRRAPVAAQIARRAADPALQEQHRQQGRVVRGPRELPDAPRDAVRRHRPAPHPVLRQPAGRLRRRPGRHRVRTAAATASRSASGRTSSRSRSAWRRRSSGRSSTPATSRTPTPSGTGGSTSSSATRTSRRSRRTSRSARPPWSWR